MPDIYGKYSLTEAADKIDATSAFINRIQRETGIGGELGKPGEKNAFDPKEVEVFHRIKLLRTIGFGFQEIKQIYVIEEDIISAARKTQVISDIPDVIKKEIRLFISNEKTIIPDPDIVSAFMENLPENAKPEDFSVKEKEGKAYSEKDLESAKAIVERGRGNKEFQKMMDMLTRYAQVLEAIQKRTEIYVHKAVRVGDEIDGIIEGTFPGKNQKE